VKYLKSNILLIILTLFTCTVFCQVIDNQLGKGFDQFPVFNPKYIKQKRIKQIKATFFTKKTGDIMRESPKFTVVEFDLLGRLVLHKEVSKSVDYTDINHLEYSYNTKDLLAREKKKLGNNWKVTDYFYDTIGQVIKEEYHLETIFFSDEGYSIQDSLLDYEISRYKNYSNYKKRIVYNSYGNPYLDIMYYFNKSNQIIEIAKKLKMTSEINETKLFYNQKNQIDSLVFFSSLFPKETESVYFTYDKYGNIIDKKIYINQKLIFRIDFVYNNKTGMLSSILKQEIASNFLSIIRFETKYFD
jgi:hypothetical protein